MRVFSRITVTVMLTAFSATGAAAQNASFSRVAEGDASKFTFPSGWSYDTLEDADVVGPDGSELGEVEAVLANAAGQVVAVAVELEEDDDREVVLELANSEAAGSSDDMDLRTSLSLEQLRALPEFE
jgi:hypothetical protein